MSYFFLNTVYIVLKSKIESRGQYAPRRYCNRQTLTHRQTQRSLSHDLEVFGLMSR